MNFNLKHPESADAIHAHGENMMGPHKERVYPTGEIQSWRMAQCVACKKHTSWKVYGLDFTASVCSDECLTAFEGFDTKVP